jgi:hypothetical protein
MMMRRIKSMSMLPITSRNNEILILNCRPTTYTGVHSAGFKDLLLKPELQRAIIDCGFEHPSEV